MPFGIVLQFERRDDVSRIIYLVRAIALLLVGLLVTSSLTVVPVASANSIESNLPSVRTLDVQLTSSDFTFYVRGTELPVPFMDLFVKPIDQIFLGEFGPGEPVPYPASVGWLGVLVGGFLRGEFHYPTAQESIRQGHETLNSYVKDVRATDPAATITVVSLSQGSIVTSASALALLAEGFDTTGIRFVAAGNPTRANGGMAARLPFHFEIPGLFSAGGDDITSNPPPTDGAEFIQVTNQYDPFADMPRYLLKPVALANWALSFVTGGVNAPFIGFGPHTYDYTDLDADDPAATPGAIVNRFGNQTDVLLPAPVGYLPITALLRGIVPVKLIEAVDPFLRSIIETAYDREQDMYQRSTFQLLPPKSRWESNIRSVRAGWDEMIDNFKELLDPTPTPLPSSTSEPEDSSSPIQVMDDAKDADITSPSAQAVADDDKDDVVVVKQPRVRSESNVIPEEESPVDSTDDSGDTQGDDQISSSSNASESEDDPLPIQVTDDIEDTDTTLPPIQVTTDDDGDATVDVIDGDEIKDDEMSPEESPVDSADIDSDRDDSDSLSPSSSESEDSSLSSRKTDDDNDTDTSTSSQNDNDRSTAKSDTTTAD